MSSDGPSSEVRLRGAEPADIAAIAQLFRANRDDLSLFQQDEPQIERTLSDFVVAENGAQHLVGCVALHWHSSEIAEILGLSVDPDCQGWGVGTTLTARCVESFQARGAGILWLATGKPGFFERLGFFEISKWELPPWVLVRKFPLVFQQPRNRWLPSLFGRHTFMKFDPSRWANGAAQPGHEADAE